MPKWFVVLSGTGIGERREKPAPAPEALECARRLMKLRRPSVRIEDEERNPVSFLQLKEHATKTSM
jgi:hypothetical protein